MVWVVRGWFFIGFIRLQIGGSFLITRGVAFVRLAVGISGFRVDARDGDGGRD